MTGVQTCALPIFHHALFLAGFGNALLFLEIKEIKLRPMIDDHDYDVKIKSMRRFFEEGDKVKVTLRFRGREMAHMQLGMQVLQRVKVELGDTVKIESEPRLEGRQMVMVLAPK